MGAIHGHWTQWWCGPQWVLFVIWPLVVIAVGVGVVIVVYSVHRGLSHG
jgi:hypothetical protein